VRTPLFLLSSTSNCIESRNQEFILARYPADQLVPSLHRCKLSKRSTIVVSQTESTTRRLNRLLYHKKPFLVRELGGPYIMTTTDRMSDSICRTHSVSKILVANQAPYQWKNSVSTLRSLCTLLPECDIALETELTRWAKLCIRETRREIQ
jgi:hypothetical protein